MLQVEPRGMMYEDVAASQTAQVLGLNGRAGDFISHVIIVPETTAAGTVALLDGAVSRNIFVTGTLADLRSFTVPLCMTSGESGGWKITTGANVHVIAVGIFS
jgi:hypothetical protein